MFLGRFLKSSPRSCSAPRSSDEQEVARRKAELHPKPAISKPESARHDISSLGGFEEDTRDVSQHFSDAFVGFPPKWTQMVKGSAITEEDYRKNPEAFMEALNYFKEKTMKRSENPRSGGKPNPKYTSMDQSFMRSHNRFILELERGSRHTAVPCRTHMDYSN
ncbi:hypothetical protein BT63DRAFT_421926 [Microthyrium microscopicum]|uniref:CRIB domain-containing protein n=1 Tax=Microthyrium microscopicum TaxID=703497 RepID=A0A6A6UNJ0_9PEZI|nr:hypothetical protein BT63DRAFT_421926 [Microthyrium microscopicum]